MKQGCGCLIYVRQWFCHVSGIVIRCLLECQGGSHLAAQWCGYPTTEVQCGQLNRNVVFTGSHGNVNSDDVCVLLQLVHIVFFSLVHM